MTHAQAIVTLRTVRPEDAPRIAELIGDWAVTQWLSSPPYPYAVADAVAFLHALPDYLGARGRFEAICVGGKLATVSNVIAFRNAGLSLARHNATKSNGLNQPSSNGLLFT